MNSASDLAAALAEAARTIDASSSLEETLDVIARSAQASIPGIEHAGISTIDRSGTITTRAASDPVVDILDEIQYRLDDGPCVEAIRQSHVVSVPDIRHDQRWPRYIKEAVESTGLQSQLAVQLFLDDKGMVGGLNLYSTASASIDPEAVEVAEAFATHAALALGHARKVSELEQGMASRKLIGQALGVLMERYEMNEARAFAFMTRASSHSNIKLRDIALEVVKQTESKGHADPPQ